MSECEYDINEHLPDIVSAEAKNLGQSLTKTFEGSIVSDNLKKVYNSVIRDGASSEDKKKGDMHEWYSFHSKNIKEGNKNMNIEKEIPIPAAFRIALIARFDTFNDPQNPDNKCVENADQAINEVLAKDIIEINKLKKYNETFLNSYRILETNFKSLRSIINSKLKELNKFSNKIDTYKQNLYIDGRKDSYENSNYDFYKSIYFYIVLFYYILIISYFIFTPFFQDKKYKNIKLVSLIVLYIFIPFMLPYLLSLIYNVYEYILESNNLRGEIISYPYIIEDKQKYE
tara:strand:+ start:79 stop:936 length:858 start_codon:yes stop_codon:yes gene_type:complete